jgi:hypothetical protein
MACCEVCRENFSKINKSKHVSAAGYDQQRLKYRFTESEHAICSSCLKRHYHICKECSMIYGGIFGNADMQYCPKCNTSDAILQFNYDPCKKLKHFFNEFGSLVPEAAQMQGEMYFGVELEVAINKEYSTRKVADETQAAIGDKFAVLKYDGSVNKGGVRGFEIVSAPATVPFHMKAWKNFFEFAEATQYFQKTHTNCGMHVHMSRTALDNAMIRRMVHLIYSQHNQPFIRGIAQRASNNYCKYTPDGANHTDDHYTALNRSKRQTVELRIFQGIVDYEVFGKNIEFCKAMYDFVANAKTIEAEDFEFENFALYVMGESELYPNLSKYFDVLDCISKKKLKKKLVTI